MTPEQSNQAVKEFLGTAALPLRARDPNKTRVLIAYPSKSGLPPYATETLFRVLLAPHPLYEFEPCVETGNHGIHFARNIIADYAMRENYDLLVELDADMNPSPEDIYRWCDLLATVDFISAPYCGKRSGPCKWMVVKKPGAGIQPNGLLELHFAGTGVHCIRVSALRQMVAAFPEREFTYEDDKDGLKQKKMTELYPMGLVGPNTPEGRLARIAEIASEDYDEPGWVWPSNGSPSEDWDAHRFELIRAILTEVHPGESRLLGEDFFFSHLARKAGLRLWCDMKHVIGHVGDAVYPISTAALSEGTPIREHNLDLDKY